MKVICMSSSYVTETCSSGEIVKFLEQSFSAEAARPPEGGYLARSTEIWLSLLGKCCWHLVVEPRDATKHLNTQGSPTAKSVAPPKVNYAKQEETSWRHGILCLQIYEKHKLSLKNYT